jgi:branched-chain amino acid transport system permease protein
MTDFFGIPIQALFGQLLLGLVNGSFYAMLSLGLAVIFGLLNVINFAHGALYMLGAFVAWMGLSYFGLNYWVMLILAPLIVGLFGIIIEKLLLKHLYKLDHLYGLLLTFGLTLLIEGLFRSFYGVSGQPYPTPDALRGATNLGFMILPNYRGWVVAASVIVCLATWFVIERTRLGALLRAGTENPKLVEAFGVNVPRMITLTYGVQPHHRRVRGRRDRRHGVHHGRHRHRAGPGRHRRPDQGVLARSLQHGRLHHHGHCSVDSPGRAVRKREMNRQFLGYAALAIVVAILPFVGVYPIFAMKVMCYALFACAFNLLLGFTGLLSFGHAAFLGSAAYAAGHAMKVWGFPTEIGLLFGVAVAALLGLAMGAIAIRRSGIYFAMITLALAQMVFFFFLQAKFTGGEDGLQSVPRGTLLGLVDLSKDLNLYYVVMGVFALGFFIIWRTVHSPFGQVLQALRENEPRAISLGYDVDRFKLLAFVLSAAIAGLAGATKTLVFVSATLSDATWQMSGLVILMTLIGGLGTLTGPILGAFIVVLLENKVGDFGQAMASLTGVDWFLRLGESVTIVIGLIFVICVLAFRRGIVGEIGAFVNRRRAARA